MSTSRLWLRLSLTGNHRCLRHRWCDEWRTWRTEWNSIVFTDESRICRVHHDGRIRIRRHCGEKLLNCCIIHCYTGPAPGVMFREGYALTEVQKYDQQLSGRPNSGTALIEIPYVLEDSWNVMYPPSSYVYSSD
ncbi:transposable element Tcb1 transposase [Trichonephila clavipes]|nr:transposable element Tcb1 transposase [Trichonephila clavipes]